jgi:hypothetical protein
MAKLKYKKGDLFIQKRDKNVFIIDWVVSKKHRYNGTAEYNLTNLTKNRRYYLRYEETLDSYYIYLGSNEMAQLLHGSIGKRCK